MLGRIINSSIQRFSPSSLKFSSNLLTKNYFSASTRLIEFSEPIEEYLRDVESRYNVLSNSLSQDTLTANQLTSLSKEFASLGQVMVHIETRKSLQNDNLQLAELIKELKSNSTPSQDDKEMIELSEFEIAENEEKLIEAENKIIKVLTPKDVDDDKNIVLEVRAGTGGDEASLFASEIFKMYENYCLVRGFKWEEISNSKTEIGGFKEASASIKSASSYDDDEEDENLPKKVYQSFKYENGVHRVQRVPSNDTKMQTSAASVIVLPEPDDIDIDIKMSDVRIDVFRSSGAGGQSVNKTESAVRMTHLPTGIVVSMQDERSQIQNRARALIILKTKLYAHERKKKELERSELRQTTNSTGDRSDKIRTYNFPQDRVTDHRCSLSINGIEKMLQGEHLKEFHRELALLEQKERIESFIEDIMNKKNKNNPIDNKKKNKK